MREVPLIVATLRVFADRRARVDGRRVLDASGHELSGPMDVTREIDAALAAGRSYQKPIKRYESSPTPSQPKNSWRKFSAVTRISMKKVNRFK